MNFKCFVFAALFLTIGIAVHAQTKIVNYKTKNSTNAADRTLMLDLLRAKMKTDYKIDFKYVVDHFKVGGNFAWLIATAQRKDGKPLELSETDDCCHVESLYKKVNGKWTILEANAFSTDVWWEGIASRTGAPQGIFE